MAIKLTETEHIRSMLNTVNEQADGNPPASYYAPPEASEDYREPGDPAEHPVVKDAVDTLNSVTDIVKQMEKTVTSDPAGAYRALTDYAPTLETEVGVLSDLYNSNEYDREYNGMVEELSDILSRQPKEIVDLQSMFDDVIQWLDSAKDDFLIDKYADEISQYHGYDGDNFAEPID